MSGTATRLYLASPRWGQELLLTMYGAWLRRLRYGGIHARALAELRTSEWRSADAHREAQAAGLRALVAHARATVPYYRERLGGIQVRDLDDLSRVPLLTKEEVRRGGDALVSTAATGRSYTIHTGGTTGTPLAIRCDVDALRRNYAFFARFLAGAGAGPRPRIATFAGRVIVPSAQRRPPYWRRNYAGHALLCSSYHLAPDTLPEYAEALRRFRPEVIDSYPSSLDPLARHLFDAGIEGIRPRAVITSSETLEPEVRARLERAFGCPVFDHYGAAEMAAWITQCPAGTYHVNPEYGIVELLRDGVPARPGEQGEIVATGFVNPRMPFLRYATGDLAVAGEEGCACGRATPVVARIIGRMDDVVVTPEGRRVGRLDPVFKSAATMLETRIVQDRRDHVRVETVLAGPWPDGEREALLRELQLRLGPRMRIDLVALPRLDRGPGGKLRGVVNLVDRPDASDPADGIPSVGRVRG